jgi:tripartite-type tricarboxylate transporter receptor subunit TctC
MRQWRGEVGFEGSPEQRATISPRIDPRPRPGRSSGPGDNAVPKKLLASAALALALATGASAAWPERPVTVIVPVPPGGATDVTARLVTQPLGQLLGQNFVVDNRPGANGGIGATQLARAPADGHTLMVAAIGIFAINGALYPNMQYDPRRDFDLVSVLVRTPNVLVVTPGFPARNIQEFIAHVRRDPSVTFASSGNGTSDHLSAALFWQRTGTQGVHIPYRGGGPAMNDLVAGHAQASFQNLGGVLPQIRAGRLRAIAITSTSRHPNLPDVPTLTESGVSGVEVYSWQAMAGPRGMPAEVRERLAGALRQVLSEPALRARFEELGFEVVGNTSAEFASFLDAEIARWHGVVREGRITIDP